MFVMNVGVASGSMPGRTADGDPGETPEGWITDNSAKNPAYTKATDAGRGERDTTGAGREVPRGERDPRGRRWARACLRAAVAAPSVHNTQPWRFQVVGDAIEVRPDLDRRLDVIDPDGRFLMISLGAAVLNLRVAVLDRNRVPVLRVRGADVDDTAARVEMGRAAVPDGTVAALAQAVRRRHTNRQPFSNTVIPRTVADELLSAAAVEGAVLQIVDPVRRAVIMSLTETADACQRGDVAYRREAAHWTTWWSGRRDGLAPETIGPRDLTNSLPLRDFGRVDDRAAERFEPHPQIAVLYTRGDDWRQWLRAGQALQRVLLTATVRGMVAQPMTQAIEVARTRALIGEPPAERYAQMVLRLGYAAPAPPSPRRALSEMLAAGR